MSVISVAPTKMARVKIRRIPVPMDVAPILVSPFPANWAFIVSHGEIRIGINTNNPMIHRFGSK